MMKEEKISACPLVITYCTLCSRL